MEKIVKKELLEDDEVEFVKEWNSTTEISWSKESKRLTESQKISIIEIKKKFLKNVTKIEPAPSTSETDPLSQEVMFKCCICFELFNYQDDLRVHAATFHSKKKRARKMKLPPKPAVYQCDTCSKMFPRRRNFIQHYRRLHDPSWFKCRKCSRTFHKLERLGVHVGQQNDCAKENCIKNMTFVCNYCKKTFTRKYYMTRHVKNLHESVPVSCPLCTKTFGCNANLKRHDMRVHRSK